MLADKIISKMLQKTPDERYTDWDSLLYDLQNLEKETLTEQDLMKSIDEKWKKVRQQWTPEWEQELPLLIRAWLSSLILAVIIFVIYNPMGLGALLASGSKPAETTDSPKTLIPKLPGIKEPAKGHIPNFSSPSGDTPDFDEVMNNNSTDSQNAREWLYASYNLQGTNYYAIPHQQTKKREYKLLFSVPIKIKQIFTGDVDGDFIPEIIAYAGNFINTIDFKGNIRSKFKLEQDINIGMLGDIDKNNVNNIIVGSKYSKLSFIAVYNFKGAKQRFIPLLQYSPASIYPLALIDSKYIIAGCGDRIFKISLENSKIEWRYALSGILDYSPVRNSLVASITSEREGLIDKIKGLLGLQNTGSLYIPNINFFGMATSIILTNKGNDFFSKDNDNKASPYNIGNIWHIVTDLNHDGSNEILCFEEPKNKEKGYSEIRLIDLKSKKVLYSYVDSPDSKWSASVADFNYDNKDEIVLSNGNKIYLLDSKLTLLQKLQLKGKIAAIANLDNDKYPAILVIAEKNLIILDKDLKVIKIIKFKEKINKAIITDIDNDLQNEIIVAADKLYVYK